MLEWLENNPVCDAADIEFLTNKVRRVQEVLRRAVQDQQQQNLFAVGSSSTISGSAPGSREGGRNWQESVPFLCLIMCLTQDHVKCFFPSRANSRSWQELDARNSQTRWGAPVCCFCHDCDYAMQLLSDKVLTSLVLYTTNTDHNLYLKSCWTSGIACNSIQLHWHQIAISTSWLQKIVPMSMRLDSLQPHRQEWKTSSYQ